jgi:hypothetical protein
MSIAVGTASMTAPLTTPLAPLSASAVSAWFAARLAASVWDNPVPGAPVPIRNLVALGRQLPPVWRRPPALTVPNLPGDIRDAGDPEAATPGTGNFFAGDLFAEDLVTAHIARFDDRTLMAHAHDWELTARPEQLPPEGDWRTWLMMGGRGSGKTRAGAEWVHALATGDLPGLGREGRIALVAESFGDAREVMIDGISGIMGVAQIDRPTFEATRRRLVWPSGAVAQMFSSEDPESLRGPQFDLAWCDELGKWRHSSETWDMLQFGLRLGSSSAAADDDDAAGDAVDAGAGEGCGHAGDADPHRGQCGESGGGVSRDDPGALWRHAAGKAGTRRRADRRPRGRAVAARPDSRRWWCESHGPLARIVVAVDPPASGEAKHSCCGIVAVGLDAEGRAVVLADGSVEGASPTRWAEAVAGSTAASTPIASSPRSTRAATWSPAC